MSATAHDGNSIIAVHGLGASSERAWVRKVQFSGEAGSETSDEWLAELRKPQRSQKDIRWLQDSHMLPKEISQARIMEFRYKSQWIWNAPRQRLTMCANSLLDCLEGERISVRR